MIDVSCLLSTIRHHSSSFSGLKWSTNHIFGIFHIATNIQSAFISLPDFSFTPVIHNASHTISSTSSFSTNSI
ncbi:MAG: hypothetical protein Q8M44_04845, partial [bacterium]|nr:hypothetical protein [bacterium]